MINPDHRLADPCRKKIPRAFKSHQDVLNAIQEISVISETPSRKGYMRAMISLKEATWEVHLRMEKRLAIKARFSDPTAYGGHIARLWAFYAEAETAWAPYLAPVLGDFSARQKAHLLERDLADVGATKISGVRVPVVFDTASALGAFYVLEGATLGGRHLLPLAERLLGLSATHGASYLASYGDQVGEMWQRFGATVEAHCQTPDAVLHAARAARNTFMAMEDWLCGADA